MRHPKAAFAIGLSAREGPALVPEKLALEEVE